LKNKETPLENALTHFVSLSKLLAEPESENFEEKWCAPAYHSNMDFLTSSEELQLLIENEMELYKLQIEKESLLSRAEEIDVNNIDKLSREYGMHMDTLLLL
jgi:hypothetical protein